MRKSKTGWVDRRSFLKSAAVGAAALAANPVASRAQQIEARAVAPTPIPPEAEIGTPAKLDVLTEERSGSDFMVDVIKSLGIEYVCCQSRDRVSAACTNRSSTTAAIKNPEFITCCHEESSVAMAPRLRQDRRQAARRVCARHRRTAARRHGHLQRLLRPRSRLHDHRQYRRRHQAPPRRRVDAQRPGRRRHGARLHQVGRSSGFASRTSPNRPCAPTRSP